MWGRGRAGEKQAMAVGPAQAQPQPEHICCLLGQGWRLEARKEAAVIVWLNVRVAWSGAVAVEMERQG